MPRKQKQEIIPDQVSDIMTTVTPHDEIKRRLESFSCVSSVTLVPVAGPNRVRVTITFREYHGSSEKQPVLDACSSYHNNAA